MANTVLFANAVDYVRVINTNAVDNLLAKRQGYVKMPSLYQRAYILVHETGEVSTMARFRAPDEATPVAKVPITLDSRLRRG